jgi:hypothetical protein
MRPVLSTRLFATVPDEDGLALVRQAGFLDVEVRLDPFERQGWTGLEALRELLSHVGLTPRAAHLPVTGAEGPLDLARPDPLDRAVALDTLRHGLDAAVTLRTRLVIVHANARGLEGIGLLLESARERSLDVALEADIGLHSSPVELVDALERLGVLGLGHGVCVDLSRTRLDARLSRTLGRRLRWLEVSRASAGQPHRPPDTADARLREEMARAATPFVSYEVDPSGPARVPPGRAELAITLRRLAAFHLGRPLQGEEPSMVT